MKTTIEGRDASDSVVRIGDAVPEPVAAEIDRRVNAAEADFESVKEAADLLGCSRERYVAARMACYPPLSWTTG